MTGDFKPEVFSKSYGFLNDAHKTELQTLREHLKRARKLLSSSPRDQLEEREAEVERLERALKRAESVVNKDRQDTILQDALVRAKRQEKEKRKEGKGNWWMKKGNLEFISLLLTILIVS
jgi:ribosomal RNA-processing protein 36